VLAVVVTLQAHPGQGDAVAPLVSALAARSREEPGCLRWEWFRAQEDPDRFLLCEVFRDEAAFAAHKDTVHVACWKEASAPLLARKDSARYTPGP
jgi:quinol monooxygenase YgiN